MKEKKNILVFRYSDMKLGGIQKILYGYIQYFLERDGKVVWVAPEKQKVDPGYRKLVNRDTITICTQAEAEGIVKALCGSFDATVVMLSFRPSEYLKMAALEQALREYDVRNYLTIAHYRGPHLFLEENYRGRKRQKAFEATKAFYEGLLKNRSIFFCSVKQAEAFEAHYAIPISDKPAYVIPATQLLPGPEESVIRARFGKQNIISVCRFVFPHKGYVLGLIRAYGILKQRYPALKLTLIGYGEGMDAVQDQIRKLEEAARKDVTVIPGVATEQLPEYYAEADVSVGLAGSANGTAGDALITLVARHYCEEAQVYGSYPDCWEKTICEEPGTDILPQLERVLNLDEEQYLAESLATRQAYENRMLPRLRDICTDYSVAQVCHMQPERERELKKMVRDAEFQVLARLLLSRLTRIMKTGKKSDSQ